MAAKLGTLLVREGVITPQQLEEALRIQVLYGGRLGTTLVELNYVSIDVMGEWLGRTTGFPVATQLMFEEATPDVLGLIPSDMAERFECFPLRKDGRRLHLAMVTPTDLAATDALSFKTGLRIVPYVAPELRLSHYLEKRCGVVRKMGYVRIAGDSRPPPVVAPPPPPLPPLPTAPAPRFGSPSVPPAVRGTTPPPPTMASTPPPTRPEVRPVSSPLPPSVPPPARVMPPSAPPRMEPVALRPTAPPAAVTVPSVPKVAPAIVAPAVPASISLDEAVEGLRNAPGREEIADILLRFGAGVVDTILLFLVRDGMALGWKGRGGGLDPAMVELVMLPLNAPSMFQETAESRRAYAGPVTEQVLHRHFFKALRRDPPSTVVVVPVVMRDRAVNLVYADRVNGDASVALPALSELARHVATAYERILRDSKKRLEGR